MDLFINVFIFIFGTVLGSFYNVVGYRVPKKIPFALERSYCPNCNNQLKFYELIPLFSYMVQRGACRSCRMKISPLYPIVELMTGGLFLFAYIKIGFTIEWLVALSLISLFVIIFVSDLRYMLIPDKVLLFFLPIFILLRILSPLTPWYSSITGSIVGFLLLALIIIISKGGMGAGDMKLFGVIGIVLGLSNTLLTFFLAALFGAVIGGIFMLFNKVEKKQPIPFGPFIMLGGLISYFYGQKLIDMYLSLLP